MKLSPAIALAFLAVPFASAVLPLVDWVVSGGLPRSHPIVKAPPQGVSMFVVNEATFFNFAVCWFFLSGAIAAMIRNRQWRIRICVSAIAASLVILSVLVPQIVYPWNGFRSLLNLFVLLLFLAYFPPIMWRQLISPIGISPNQRPEGTPGKSSSSNLSQAPGAPHP